MMKKIIYVLIYALILVFLLGGCTQNANKDTTPRKLTDYVGGDKGLSFKFEEGAPPSEIFDEGGDDFSIALQIKNEGEYTVQENGIIASLSGINQKDFSIASLHRKNDIELERKYPDRDGETLVIDFGNANYKVDLTSDFATKIVADICYDYRTRTAAAICLRKDTRQYQTADVCKITNEDVVFENSAAPIQITDVDESSAGRDKVKLTFTIENKGEGAFYKPEAFKDRCIPDEAKKDENYVYVILQDPSSRLRFECSALGGDNKGTVRLYDNKKTISCLIPTSGLQDTAFEQLIDITVDYVYRDAISQDIKIKNANVY